MPTFEITAPDGKTFEVTGPEGSTKEQALAQVQAQYKSPAAPSTPAATAGDRAQAGASGVGRGIAGLAGLPVDTVENIINLGIAAYGTAKQGLTGQPGPELLKGSYGGSQYITDKLQNAGVNLQNPRPDDMASRMLHTGGMIAGGSALPGVGAKNTLAAALGGSVAGEVSDNPLAPAIGSMLPGAAMQAGAAVKANMAGKAADNIQTFKEAGVTPSVGQATESNFFRGIENLVSKVPGGHGVIRSFAEAQAKKIGDGVVNNGEAAKAGRTVESGITGEGGFLERTKNTWKTLDDKTAALLPKDAVVQPTNTVNELNRLTAPVAGATNFTEGLVNPKLVQFRKNIEADIQANGGTASVEGLRVARSRVGEMLDNALVSGIGGGELKALYKGLSKDIEAAAKAAGPEAMAAFERQNNYYTARMDRVDGVLSKVLGNNKTPEQIFDAISPKNPDQSSVLTATMRSLKPEDRQIVTDAVVNRLGRATKGQQNDTGDKFSTETFLSNWSSLNPKAKAQLFPEQAQRTHLEAVAKASQDIRDGTKIFANPSGTASNLFSYMLSSSVPVAWATGNIAPVVGAAGVVAGANITARMLTSPKVVQWLAQSTKTKPEQYASQLSRLAVIYNSEKDGALKQDLAAFVNR